MRADADNGFKGKLLILDGISGVSLGREIQREFVALGVSAGYYDCASLQHLPLYRLRSGVFKLLNKWEGVNEFFHLPKARPDVVSDIMRKEQPEAVLVIGFIYKFIEPLQLRKLADQLNCSLYLYDTDSCNLYSKRREFVFFLENELVIYDSIFSFSKVTSNLFRNTRGLNAHFLPFGASAIEIPSGIEEHRDVLFVGSGDLRRILLLESIAEHVSIFGNRWRRNYPLISETLKARIVDKPVWGRELHRLMAESKIVLNITRGPFYAAETGINLRIFEALAAGKFLLADHSDELAELFEVGVEIETFSSSTELQQKVRYYLENPEQRMAIARRGHERYLREFTWRKRVEAMLEYIKP